jgi:hypothetical protein
MEPEIHISYEPNSCIVTLNYGFKEFEGHGETLASAVYDLAGTIEMDNYTRESIEEITGVTI